MKKKLRIILIANTSHFFNVFMLNHIKQLSKKYDLFICCNEANKLKKNIPNNVSLVNIKLKRGISFFHDMSAFFFVIYFFLKKKPDFLISFTPKVGFIAIIASFITGIPNRIHWFTGQIWATKKGLYKMFFKSIDKLIFSLSHKVFIDGFSQQNFLIKENIVTLEKSKVLNKGSVGGVDVTKFKFSQKKRKKLKDFYSINKNSFIFLYLGRINRDKGINELVEAFKKIKNNYDILLIFVGEIEDNSLVSLLEKKDKILYFNFTTKPEEWLSVADVLCLPSHREGFGTVVIEAASSSVPALCAKIYGLQDALIDNKTGFFHKVGSVNDIKKKMLYIINNKKLVKNYGKCARKRVLRDFDQNIITKKFLNFLDSKIH